MKVFEPEYFRDRLCEGVRTKLYAEREDFVAGITANFELRRMLTSKYNKIVEDFCDRLNVTVHTSNDETGKKNFVFTISVKEEVESSEVDDKSSV